MPKFEGCFSVVGAQLELAIEFPGNERRFELQDMTSLRNEEARLLLSDGGVANSELAHLPRTIATRGCRSTTGSGERAECRSFGWVPCLGAGFQS